MAIALKLSADDYGKLEDGDKTSYKADGEGGYVLDVVGGFVLDKDPAGLLNARDHEKTAHDKTKEALKAAEDKLKEVESVEDKAKREQEEADRKKAAETGDVGSVQAEMDKRFADMEAKHAKELKDRDDKLADQQSKAKESAMTARVNELVGKMSLTKGSDEYMRFEVRQQLDFDESGQVVFKGADGKADLSMTNDGFLKKVVDMDKYAAIMVASNARGGSASPTADQGNPVDLGGKKWNDLSSSEKSALSRDNRDEYDRLLEAHKAESPPTSSTLGDRLKAARRSI